MIRRCGNCNFAYVNTLEHSYLDLVCRCPEVDRPGQWVHRSYFACPRYEPLVYTTPEKSPSPTSGS